MRCPVPVVSLRFQWIAGVMVLGLMAVTGTAASMPIPSATREITLHGKLLLVPVSKVAKTKGDPRNWLSIRVDGKLVQIGWAQIDMGGDMPFNQTFSLPLDLTLKTTKDGIRMFANPIEELNTLHEGEPQTLVDRTVTNETPIGLDIDGQLFDIRVTIRKGDAAKVTLTFGRNAVTYDFASEMLDNVPAPLLDGLLKLRVLVDRPMFEVAVNDGQSYRTAARCDGGAPLGTLAVKTEGGSVGIVSLEAFKMKSIWNN